MALPLPHGYPQAWSFISKWINTRIRNSLSSIFIRSLRPVARHTSFMSGRHHGQTDRGLSWKKVPSDFTFLQQAIGAFGVLEIGAVQKTRNDHLLWEAMQYERLINCSLFWPRIARIYTNKILALFAFGMTLRRNRRRGQRPILVPTL